jgi:MFS family permease
MIKAGLIGIAASLIYVTSMTLVLPFCTVCITPLLGFGVGYLAVHFDKPPKLKTCLRVGGFAGGITGVATLLGQMLATVINGILMTNWKELPDLVKQLGLTQFPNANEYWQTTLAVNSFCSVLNLVIIVTLGMGGAMLWFQRHHKPLATASI